MSTVSAGPARRAKAKVFISYSHKDERHREALELQLKLLERTGYVESVWTAVRLVAGAEWRAEIETRLRAADLIILLVSIDFLASDFCWDEELALAIERHNSRAARVVPVHLRTCDVEETPIENLHGVPPVSKPVLSWSNRNKAWHTVGKGLKDAVREWRLNSGEESRSPARA